MAFEAAVLETLPGCEIHVFDKDSFGLEKWFPDPAVRAHVKFHRYFIAHTDDTNADPPMRSLSSIMAELGHKHLDILKVDIEVKRQTACARWCGVQTCICLTRVRQGAELQVLRGKLPSIGQLQVEVHLSGVTDAKTVYKELFATLEQCGLRLFHKEINARYDDSCVELSFIQKEWRPEKKLYTSNEQ